MSVTLKIGANFFSMRASTGKLSLSAQRRGTLSFTLRDNRPVGVGSSPKIGNTVVLEDTVLSTVYFKGFIDSFRAENVPGDRAQTYEITCIDFNSIADRILVTGSWTGVNAGNIASQIVDNFLAGDGVTHTNVASGPVIPFFSVSGVPAKQAFDELCQNTGQVAADTTMSWFIDNNKDLHMFAANVGAGGASFQISDSSTNWKTAKLTEDGSNYANRVTVHSGQALGDTGTTDTLNGNGSTRSFTTTGPVGSVPEITLNDNAAPLTVGVNGVDTGKQYYYTLGSTAIVQDVSQTILTNADNLYVTYYMPVVTNSYVTVDDTGAQANRQVYEGGSGIHAIAVDNTGGTVSDAINVANALLKQHVTIPVTFDIEMVPENVDIPSPGEMVTTTLVNYGFPDPVLFMIQTSSADIEAKMGADGNADCLFRWSFQMVRGYQAGWEKVLWSRPGSLKSNTPSRAGPDLILFTFDLFDMTVGSNVANPLPVPWDIECVACTAIAKTAPAADCVVDLKDNGTSIFGVTKMVVPSGSAALQTQTVFSGPRRTVLKSHILTCDVNASDPTVRVTVVLTGKASRLN